MKHVLSTLLVSSLSFSALADVITIRADEWYPVNGVPGAEKPGYMIELAQTIMSKHGHQVDYQLMPWERAIDSAAKGSTDCVVGAAPGDVPQLTLAKNAWGSMVNAFYVGKGNDWRYEGVKSLDSVTTGVVSGYSYGDELDGFIEANPKKVQKIRGDDTLGKNLKKLLAGRIDVVIESPMIIEAELKSKSLEEKVQFAGDDGSPMSLHIACTDNDKGKQYTQLFSEGVAELRSSGELNNILARYGVNDWL